MASQWVLLLILKWEILRIYNITADVSALNTVRILEDVIKTRSLCVKEWDLVLNTGFVYQ